MDGGHTKNPLPAGHLEVGDLKDHWDGLKDKYSSHKDEDQLLFGDHGYGAQDSTQGQRPHVAHKEFSGVGVIP